MVIIRDNVLSEEITVEFVKSEDQFVDMFVKGSRVNYFCNKLNSYDIYDTTRGRVLRINIYT